MAKTKATEEVAEKTAETKEVKAEKVTTPAKTENVLDKKLGNFSVKQILIAVLCVVVVLVVIKGVTSVFSSDSKVPDYQVVYTNDDGDLMVNSANGKKEVKLANENGGAVYASSTDRYILFGKNDDLYLYDKKHAEDSQKVGKNVSSKGFNANDEYVWYINNEGDLYSYKKESNKIDSDVKSVALATKDKIIYTKSGDDGAEIYMRDLKGKKDKVKVAKEVKSYYVSADGKVVAYINADQELHLYKTSSKKDTKVSNDIVSIGAVKDDLSVMYVADEDSNIYIVKGTKATKIVDEVEDIAYIDAEKEILVFTLDDTLYYKKGTKKEVKITDDTVEKITDVEVVNDKEIYYVVSDKDKELFYSKISGSKASTPKSVTDDVYSVRNVDFAKGLVVFTDVKNSVGTINVVKGGKIQKITDDVYTSVQVSLSKKKIYFLGDYSDKNSTGTLMSSTGKKAKKMIEDVYSYDYVKDDMIYVATGYSTKSGKFDLGCYNGHKVIKVAESVKSYVSHPSNKKHAVSGSGGYSYSSSSSSYDDDYDYDDDDYDYDDDYYYDYD